MRRYFLPLLAIVFTFSSAVSSAGDIYNTDQGHTEIRFGWSHAGVSVQTAEFTSAKGVLDLDPKNYENSSIDVTIDADSLSSGFELLDKDLKSKNFLEVDKYPTITFKSTRVKMTGDNTMNVTGDLTIHGVTKPVTLKAEVTHRGKHPVAKILDYYKGNWIAFHASAEIDHQDFGVGSFSTGPIDITIATEMKKAE